MTGSTPPNTLAEEGAKVTRAINDTIKRFTAAGPNFGMDGSPRGGRPVDQARRLRLSWRLDRVRAQR